MIVESFPPVVSIVTPFYNSEAYLSDFVEMLQAQSFTRWVCILVDDYSTDNSSSVLATLTKDDERFSVISNHLPKHLKCPSSARNLALQAVSTDYIAFCDIDDVWHPEKLLLQLQTANDLDADLIVTAYGRFFRDTGRPVHAVVYPPDTIDLPSLLYCNYIPLSTVLVRSSVLRAQFSEVRHEDYLYWLCTFAANPSIRCISLSQLLAFSRRHANNITKYRLVMPIWAFNVYRRYGFSSLSSMFLTLRWSCIHLISITKSLLSPLPPLLRNCSVSLLLEMPPQPVR